MTSRKKDALIWLLVFIIIGMAAIGIKEFVLKDHAVPVAIDNPAPVVATTTPDLFPGWKTYNNPVFNYSFKYPSTVTFTKDMTVYSPVDGTPTTYKAGEQIKLSLDDISDFTVEPRNALIAISPMYVNIHAIRKPKDYTTFKKYTDDIVDQTIAMGERSAAGIYATSDEFHQDGLSGYLIVVSDGSVVKNRDDQYYFEHGDYIYVFDIAYSGYNYQTKDADEMMRVDLNRQILSTFKFTR